MIEYVTNPFPDQSEMKRLWLKAWGDEGHPSFPTILQRSLGHVGAYDNELLIGFVNVAWDGGVHAFILDTCVDRDWQRQGIASTLVSQAADLARKGGAEWLHVPVFKTRRSRWGVPYCGEAPFGSVRAKSLWTPDCPRPRRSGDLLLVPLPTSKGRTTTDLRQRQLRRLCEASLRLERQACRPCAKDSRIRL